MRVLVQSKSMAVTDALRAAVEKEAEKFAAKESHIVQVSAFLEVVKRKTNDEQSSTARFVIQVPGKDVVIEETSRDLYQAIHLAARAAKEEIRERKEMGKLHHLPS